MLFLLKLEYTCIHNIFHFRFTNAGKKKRDDNDEDLDKFLAELRMEYSGQKKPGTDEASVSQTQSDDVATTGKKPKATEKEKDEENEAADAAADGEEVTIKTAAQKRKEKKEREKLKKLAQKKAVRARHNYK